MSSVLAHDLLHAPGAAATQWMFFVHGLLGTRANLRSVARRFIEERPAWGACLVDLRMHGESQGFRPPHTLASAATDLATLAATLPAPVRGICGHSLGGKTALAWLAGCGGDLDHVFILDANPGSRSDVSDQATIRILDRLASLPRTFPSRRALTEAFKDYGSVLGTWLAMNLAREPDGTFRWVPDLDAMRSLITDYFARDLWPIVANPPGQTAIHLLIAKRAPTFDAEETAYAKAHAHPRFDVTVVDTAHWVHAEAPELVVRFLTDRVT